MEAGPAIVTGASRGIGHAIAAALVAAGHPVLATARDEPRLLDAADALRARSDAPVATIAADLRRSDAPAAIVDHCVHELGPPAILVNNAGTAPSARFSDTGDEVLDEVLDLHVRAPFRLMRAALATVTDGRNCTIVQLASTAGLRGYPFTSAYCTAKHALVGLTRALRAELAPSSNVRPYAVCPGFVDTEITRSAARSVAARGGKTVDEALATFAAMNRIGRLHSAEEIADAVVRLCHDRPDGCILDLDAEPPTWIP